MFRMKMKRYSAFPLTLYRCQWAQTPTLRERNYQFANGSTSFDFLLGSNRMYNPAMGDRYLGPNGLSLRPIGVNLAQFVESFTGKFIFQFPAGLQVPSQMVLIHERTDHYSLQTKTSIKPQEFCLKVSAFFKERKQLSLSELKERIRKELTSQK